MGRLAPVGVLVAVALALGAPAASAHALLRSSDPAEGARLERSPGVVTLVFTEEPEPALASLRLLDASGRARGAGKGEPAPGNPLALRLGLEPLPEGVYTLTWRVVSRVDGHVTAGAVAFGVGVTPEAGAARTGTGIPEAPPLSPLEMGARFAFLAGLVVLVGGGVAGLAAFGSLPGGARPLALCGWAVSAVGLAGLAEAQRRAAGAALGAFLGTFLGRALMWRGAALLAAGVALAATLGARGRGARLALALLAAAASGALLAHVAAGHAAAGTLPAAKVASQWAHAAAVGVWIGGLAALLAGIRGLAGAERARAVRRFSASAAVALAVVAATGALRGIAEVGSVAGLVTTPYGRIVALKVGLLLALAALGAVNRFRHVPVAAGSVRGLRRVGGVELGLAAVAIAASSALAALTPSASIQAAAEGTRVVARGSDFARTVRVALEAEPGQAGANRFTLRLSGDEGAVDAERVLLRFLYLEEAVGEADLELAPAGKGVFAGRGSQMSLEGRWRVVVLVGRGTDSVEIPLELTTRCRAEGVAAPGQPTLHVIQAGGGRSAQGYVDPGRPGENEVHVTFFDEEGAELAIAESPAMSGRRTGVEQIAFGVRRFGPGHFVADADLRSGRWRFDVRARDPSGEEIRACFEEVVER